MVSTHLSSTEIRCLTPAQQQGDYIVEVSSSEAEITQQRFMYSYHAVTQVRQVFPAVGAIVGNTLVTVSGRGFVRGLGLVCRFGVSVPVSATWLSDELLLCTARPFTAAGNVSMEVSINNQDFSSSGVMF